MKIYFFNDPVFKGDEIVGNVVQEYTREDVLQDYWKWWHEKMVAKYGEGHELITEDNCIEDWKVINFAWEVEIQDE